MSKDWTVEFSEQALAKMADPECAEMVREQLARIKQVIGEFEAGRFKSIDEAFESIGMEPVDPDDRELCLIDIVSDDGSAEV